MSSTQTKIVDIELNHFMSFQLSCNLGGHKVGTTAAF
jgi:hypothetical protein